jgi:hypothetical protein
MAKKPGLHTQSGKQAENAIPNNINDRIDEIFDAAESEFHDLAASEALNIFRGFVPIDTHTLQQNIKSIRDGDYTVVYIPDATLIYTQKPFHRDARRLAAILNVGVGRAGQLLNRTRTNTMPGTGAGQPTKGWLDDARQKSVDSMRPVARQLMRDAISQAIKAVFDNG